MVGTIVNVGAIIVGATAGVVLRKGIPERFNQTIIQGIALTVMIIGIQMAVSSKNILVVVLSIVVGGLTGEILKIEERLDSFGLWIEERLGDGQGDFARGFVTASLVYCVGAMAIVGSIQDGLQGNPATLFVKALLDGVSAVFFASTMGLGVAFSAIPVLLYQGSITLLAQYVQAVLTQPVIIEMTATGGILILGIGIKILGIKEIRVGNLLPSIFYAVAISIIFQKVGF